MLTEFRFPLNVSSLFCSVVFFLCVLVGDTLCADIAPDSTNSPSHSELFKSFLASPPPIESIVYRVKLLADPTQPDLGVARSTNYEFYVALWQTNAWSVRTISPDDKLDSKLIPGRSIFVLGDNYAHLEPGTAIYWVDHDPVVQGVKIDIPTKTLNRTKVVAQFLKRTLSETLNMGVFNLEPGTIKWEGNRFKEFYAERGQNIEGELFASSGLPSHMQVTYQAGTNVGHYMTRYSYGKDVGISYLPEVIRVFRLVRGKEKERAETMILSIKAATGPVSESYFDVTPFIATNQLEVRYYTNGTLYELNKRGQLIVAKETPPAKVRGPSPNFFYAAVTATTAAFLALAIRAKRSAAKPISTQQ
jgi:hypothetical protein